ncbi:hypothetical protein LTR36_004316 [Oleoguttula mirabilis]|uniref:Septation initiation network scaffold protein cdc11 n=1 Tax=Oleoguttula mirabilis TaxID=1507867 RepID=A0AAV9JGJ3_9PEZI|nr:hypothetical protein LTR36_004316 [Oleoguttula mirabilis]
MAGSVAPWLEGLSESWEAPVEVAGPNSVSSATHNASSLRSTGSTRMPKRSLSGLPSSLGSQKTSSTATTQMKRSPLAPLSHSKTNTFQRQHGTTKLAGTRSVSETSDGSMLQCGTVQQRSKSASPAKMQETLEWKRRLVQGKLGYGDQTDLFGPSGLENIFTNSKGVENDAPQSKGRMKWLQKSDAPMPSSPPPWPSSFTDGPQSEGVQPEESDELEAVDEEQSDEYDDSQEPEEDGSFGSNPFDLRNTDELEDDRQSVVRSSQPEADVDQQAQCQAANRTVSGQTELSQEEFSPVFISKHTTVNGEVNYAALDSHLVKQFNSMKVDLRHPSQEQPQMDADEEEEEEEEEEEDSYETHEQSAFTDGPQSECLHAVPDLSLSENLPTGTPPVPSLGRYVELKRGGYSTYGSFKQRPLSPSPSRVGDSMLPEKSELLSPVPRQGRPLPEVPSPIGLPPTTPLRPVTPNPPKSRSSGSPLKLFAAHDTFTNNRLLRRMSQLDPEGNPIKDLQESITARQPAVATERSRVISKSSIRNSFGSGELDSHCFDAEITITSASDSEKNDSLGSPGSEIAVPGGFDPLGFRHESSLEVKDTFKLKRKLSKQSAAKSSKNSTLEGPQMAGQALNTTVEDVSALDAYSERAERVKDYDGSKRPPTSPFKNPTPKRRRTLHASELLEGVTDANTSFQMQLQEAASSRKRRDARDEDSQATAEPDMLASRKILRPRNPTPSQCRRQQVEAELREAAEEFAAQEPEKLEAVMEQIESSMAGSDGPPTLQQQAEAVATEVANFTMRVHKPSGEHGGRKRSVTTQDFLNEAMMVMQLIRSKARPQSGLGSVEESDAEGLSMSNSLRPEGSMLDAGISLRVSRPPSREGGHSGWRSGMQSQTDARVVSHLRRFQERDDTEFIADSVASLHVDDEESLNDNVIVVDEHSNIRITGPPPHLRRDREEFDDSRPVSQRSQGSTLHTQQSAGTDTGHTIGTSSTRKSDNVGTLAPDAVAHLIGEQVGGMTFDKESQRWIRVKSPERKSAADLLELPSQLTSDDDPFREISDLPIDEQQEIRHTSFDAKNAEQFGEEGEDAASHDERSETTTTYQQPSVESRTTSTETVVAARPETRDSSHMQSGIHHIHSSSVPSRYTAFASSQHEKVETRATSYNDEELARMSAMGKARRQPLAYAAAQATLALRGQRDTVAEEPVNEVSEVSEVTFPSPSDHQMPTHFDHMAEQQHARKPISPDAYRDQNSLREDTVLHEEGTSMRPIASPKQRRTPAKLPSAPPSTYRTMPRQMTLRQQTLTNRFTAETREQSELSFVAALPGERMMSLSLSVSRPLTTRHQSRQIGELQPSPSKADPNATFLMSDLPEFTIHEVDEERPSSERALATRLAQHAAAEINDRYAVAGKDVVKALTDVQGGEPYWDDLKQLDLHHRSLASLHGLDEFCTRVWDMDVSDNALTQLGGAPFSVRRLVARHNQLNSLTCWNGLFNLQYLDISGNQLDSLRGLSHLVHLRELCADDNQITSLDGVLGLDGLLKLRLRRNAIDHVDFAGCQLQRLTSLDLSNNVSTSVESLEELTALKRLRLDGTLLDGGLEFRHRMLKLKHMSLRACGLAHLDVSMLPSLRSLELDDNSLPDVKGIAALRELELLSMRRQLLPDGVRMAILDHPVEARRFQLSGNTIPSLQLSHSFLNLQQLELASVGVQELPPDFGLRMPNLRTLNLNFNSLRDIRPLLNIQMLEHLSICGNRLDRLRKSVATLAKLASLRSLDLRDNPVTQGFYHPALAATQSLVRKVYQELPEEDVCAEMSERAKHCLPRGDIGQDGQHQHRLDEATKLRRRVYELLLAHSCTRLRDLDGLLFDKTLANTKDRTWERLVELGVVRKSRSSSSELSELQSED